MERIQQKKALADEEEQIKIFSAYA